MYDNALGVEDISAEICAPLYRAHDVLHAAQLSSMLKAVKTEKARRRAAPQGRPRRVSV
jgi:hypothetical protein